VDGEQRRARELAASILGSVASQDWLTLLFEFGKVVSDSGPSNEELLPRRNLDSGLTGGRLSRSGAVRISTYFRTL
jgi:hypothetical protein